eukprot:CAMPEP_0197190130 /NCGR_PEP_ID=MMETSP1423-20130617/21040_1 /TAXON_ID=476441 /ORGANISM="Pseudo-nitzschia heimii, Strain UNC1101" /LENGTH=32 /DNA_ID= /DNA_START= /DNA_END= /DNA_ORIENTATION=
MSRQNPMKQLVPTKVAPVGVCFEELDDDDDPW